ncbi:branched-chain amino acid ABC transporter permease [Polynucleobacter sp. AP-Melu-500A-A1]|jgi:branched-chain amino acid transport system permease protein|uniref:branched-chain amino acid ABC transporter permease n=1 Tax=Polynucleobacter sp. AP-Melu-500A-A1 TaxID=2576929 RepID=UPI001C0B3038|nr:branched-chain amino acid ABC transporter permease [Polynucleobacter sp. AP-Melu-500A-A1]MBU3630840.1 branched-chain amino acid ABC transporter permease [Polynucleobacter sp. AP-Melu-500A-A1]
MNSFFQLVVRHRVFASTLFLAIFPFIMPYEALAINILIFGLFAMGFNLLFGYMGLLSFGHAAFLGAGSYLTGISIVHYGLPWGTAILIGVIGAAITGLIMGFLAIRTRGIYFSMVTLALGQIIYYLFYKAESLTGGENGLRGVRVDTFNILGIPVDFLNPLVKYYIILFFVVIAIWFISRILNSPLGAVMEAIRENEKRASACGFDVTRTKLLVFVLSAAICGLAGSLRALHLSIVPIDSLHYLQSGQAVMMSILGGMGTFFGPFIGAAVMLYLEDVVTTFTKHWMAVIGIIFMFFVLFFPKGIWGTILSKLQIQQDSK